MIWLIIIAAIIGWYLFGLFGVLVLALLAAIACSVAHIAESTHRGP